MKFFLKRIFPMLAVLVVACAQVSGMQRGFICDHHGTAVVTEAGHCHQVAEGGKVDFAPCGEDVHKDCSDQEDTEDHAPLTLQLQTSTAGLGAVAIPVFVAVLVAENAVHEWMLIQTLTKHEMLKTPLDTGGESPPPAALQVARCMVILV